MVFPTKQFLNVLVANSVLTQEASNKLEMASLQKDLPIHQFLLDGGFVKKEEVLKVMGTIIKVPTINAGLIPISPQAMALIPESLARKYILIPFEYDEQNAIIKVVMENPLDLEIVDFLVKKTGKKIIPHIGLHDDILKAIDVYYSQGLSPDVILALKEVQPEKKPVQQQLSQNMVTEAPIAKIVSVILEYAMKSRASDIHIEPQESRTRVRYRIDGILQEKLSLPKGIHESLVSRIKILSELKIDEKRIPQDGRFNFKITDMEVDLRVSTLPTVHGEKVVMRLLKKTGGIPTLNDLGFGGPQLQILEEAISKPYGIILVTGPTGSGKSTTLYSILNRLNKPGVNIVTLEDPVEYQLAGLNQVQINPQAGLTFASGLRSFLRQDPNIILVGEIRDKETTGLAIQAALTGHLVFSTLHTNDAATAIPRLIDLGAEPFLISSVLNASVAQRICRRICKFCKKDLPVAAETANNIKEILGNILPKKYKDGEPIKLYRGDGCAECENTGYLGRVAIFETIKITGEINKLIMRHATAKEISEQARTEGLIGMKQDGYLKSLEGITTIEEVLRVAEI